MKLLRHTRWGADRRGRAFPEYIIPKAFDPRVGKTVAAAVAEAARKSGSTYIVRKVPAALSEVLQEPPAPSAGRRLLQGKPCPARLFARAVHAAAREGSLRWLRPPNPQSGDRVSPDRGFFVRPFICCNRSFRINPARMRFGWLYCRFSCLPASTYAWRYPTWPEAAFLSASFSLGIAPLSVVGVSLGEKGAGYALAL